MAEEFTFQKKELIENHAPKIFKLYKPIERMNERMVGGGPQSNHKWIKTTHPTPTRTIKNAKAFFADPGAERRPCGAIFEKPKMARTKKAERGVQARSARDLVGGVREIGPNFDDNAPNHRAIVIFNKTYRY